METRYRKEVDMACLWYVDRPKEMETISMRKADMDSLIQARNLYAAYLKHDCMKLPEMLMNTRTCQRCPYQAECAVLHKVTSYQRYLNVRNLTTTSRRWNKGQKDLPGWVQRLSI